MIQVLREIAHQKKRDEEHLRRSKAEEPSLKRQALDMAVRMVDPIIFNQEPVGATFCTERTF